jgi:hypothetical protein
MRNQHHNDPKRAGIVVVYLDQCAISELALSEDHLPPALRNRDILLSMVFHDHALYSVTLGCWASSTIIDPRTETQKMNRIQIARFILSAVAGLALVSGCSSAGPANGSGASTASLGGSNDEFVPPFRGETRAQVMAQYDEPDQVFQSSETEETWVYFFGKAKQFIPFYGPFAERRILIIHFNQYGRVIGWKSRSNRPY